MNHQTNIEQIIGKPVEARAKKATPFSFSRVVMWIKRNLFNTWLDRCGDVGHCCTLVFIIAKSLRLAVFLRHL